LKKIKLLFLVCIVLVSLSACSKDNAQPQSPNKSQQQSPKTNTPATEPVVVGTSTSCDKPPKQLELSGKTYQLKSENAKGEPVMKLAYIKCDKGKFTLGDAEDSYTVHYAGDPSKNNGDILLLGNWGGTGSWSQALYSLDEKTPSLVSVEPFLSLARPCIEDDRASAANNEMDALLKEAVNYFNNQTLKAAMSKGDNSMGVETVALKAGSPITMIYRTSLPNPNNEKEVPIITIGFGLGVNAVESHGLLWYESGNWHFQPYPQAPKETSESRLKQLKGSPYCSGSFVELHQKGDYLVVVYARGVGTHPGQEVHLLKRNKNVWSVIWAPTYPDWSVLWDSRVEMKDGDIDKFYVHRRGMKSIDEWKEEWNLQGDKYVLLNKSK
jgi:hypothetical protein